MASNEIRAAVELERKENLKVFEMMLLRLAFIISCVKWKKLHFLTFTFFNLFDCKHTIQAVYLHCKSSIQPLHFELLMACLKHEFCKTTLTRLQMLDRPLGIMITYGESRTAIRELFLINGSANNEKSVTHISSFLGIWFEPMRVVGYIICLVIVAIVH